MPPATQTAVLDREDSYDGLTAKQYRFVMLSFSGLSDYDAYRQVYDCNGMNEHTVRASSVALAHNPLVTAKIRDLSLKAEQQATLAPAYTRAFVVNGIAAIALAGDKDSTRLRAFELLGKTRALNIFAADTEPARKERTLAELDEDLRAAIASLKPTLDATPAKPATDNAPVMSRKRKPLPPG